MFELCEKIFFNVRRTIENCNNLPFNKIVPGNLNFCHDFHLDWSIRFAGNVREAVEILGWFYPAYPEDLFEIFLPSSGNWLSAFRWLDRKILRLRIRRITSARSWQGRSVAVETVYGTALTDSRLSNPIGRGEWHRGNFNRFAV